MTDRPLLEVCADSAVSCLAAARGGADRAELCGHLAIGGVTPSPVVFRQIRRACGLPIRVLIRPRFGDFLYSETELEEMEEEISMFRDLGADGVVIGVLTPQGELDLPRMERLMDRAGGIKVTLHRAFDMTRDPFAALEGAVRLGCDAILTSGQAASAMAGADLLARLQTAAAGRIRIMAGSGVNKGNICRLYAQTGVTAFHTSARAGAMESGMVYRKAGVSMGLPSLSEYELWQTDEGEVRACAREVRSLEGEESL